MPFPCFSYVRTLPAEYKFWRDKGPQIRLKCVVVDICFFKLKRSSFTSLILFVLIRYVSIVTLVISNVGYFSHSFSAKACKNFYMVSVVMKGRHRNFLTLPLIHFTVLVLQTTICQFILGIR